MEEFKPGIPSEPEPSTDEEKKKKRKRRGQYRFGTAVEIDTELASEKKPLSALDIALANLAIKRRKEAEAQPEVAKKKAEDKAEPKTEETNRESADESSDTQTEPDEFKRTAAPLEASRRPGEVETKASETSQSEDEPAYKNEATQNLEPHQFSGGEVIYSRSDNEPVTEHVLPLRTEATQEAQEPSAAEPDPTHEPVEGPQPVSRAPAELRPAFEAAESTEPDEPVEPDPTQAPAWQTTSPSKANVAPSSVHSSGANPNQGQNPNIVPPVPPAAYYNQQQMPNNANVLPTNPHNPNQPVFSKQDVEDAMYGAAKSAQSRGVLTGLLVGGAYEHFKHKRREKRQNKRFKQQAQKLEQTNSNLQFNQQEQAKQQAVQSSRLATAESRYLASEKRFHTQSTQPEPSAGTITGSGWGSPERAPQSSAERLRQSVAEAPDLSKSNVAAVQASEQPLEIPKDHRIETSAWHAIEIDSKTGKPAEHPSLTYGQEYFRERAHENTPVDSLAAQSNNPTALAKVGAAVARFAGSSAPKDSTGVPPNASQQGPPKTRSEQAKSALSDAGKRMATSSGPVWPWVVALAVIVIVLFVLM